MKDSEIICEMGERCGEQKTQDLSWVLLGSASPPEADNPSHKNNPAPDLRPERDFAPRVGLEPTTLRLRYFHNFRCGPDYLIILRPYRMPGAHEAYW